MLAHSLLFHISLDFMNETTDNERVNMSQINKLEKEFTASMEHRRRQLHAQLASVDKDEAEGLEAFRILREKVSHNGTESIVKAMQFPFQSGSLMEEMQAIIPALTGSFDINTIREIIEGRNPTIRLNPTSVSNNLRKLWREGLLERVAKGQGNKTSEYKISQQWRDKIEEEKIERLPVPDFS